MLYPEFYNIAVDIANLEAKLHEDLQRAFVGKKVRITSKIWNGQTFGKSRKPQTGKIATIWHAHCTENHGIYFQVSEYDASLSIGECELLP